MDQKGEHSPGRVIIVLDRDAPDPGGPGVRLLWSELEAGPGQVSVPGLADKMAERLRDEYLAWIHDLGGLRFRGKTLRRRLELQPGLSFWWLTTLAEKSTNKTPEIFQVFKLRALEFYSLEHEFDRLTLCSDDETLHGVLAAWCRATGRAYRRLPGGGAPVGRAWKERLPSPLRALWTLAAWLLTRLRHLRPPEMPPAGEAQATVVSYFPNLDWKRADQGEFYSRYWQDLHRLWDQDHRLINYVWVFVPNNECNYVQGAALAQELTSAYQGRRRFYLMEQFLGLGGMVWSLGVYLRLAAASMRLGGLKCRCRMCSSDLDLWPIMAPAWRDALRGSQAMASCLRLSAFQRMASHLPRQDYCLYLWENQDWERALCWAWHRHGQKPIIGFQHSVLKPLMVRFFEDPRTWRNRECPLPAPDLLAVGGDRPRRVFTAAGYPPGKIVEVEAVRYLYLNRMEQRKAAVEIATLLVVGGFRRDATASQIALLRQAQKLVGEGMVRVLVKPHPYLPLEEMTAGFPDAAGWEFTNQPLANVLPAVTMAYLPNNSSVVLEAAYSGLPCAVHLDPDLADECPLRGWPSIVCIKSAEDLARWIKAPPPVAPPRGMLHLDQNLQRWRRLLGVAGS